MSVGGCGRGRSFIVSQSWCCLEVLLPLGQNCRGYLWWLLFLYGGQSLWYRCLLCRRIISPDWLTAGCLWLRSPLGCQLGCLLLLHDRLHYLVDSLIDGAARPAALVQTTVHEGAFLEDVRLRDRLWFLKSLLNSTSLFFFDHLLVNVRWVLVWSDGSWSHLLKWR